MQTASRHVRGKCGIHSKRTMATAAVRPQKLQAESSLKLKAKPLKKKPQAWASSAVCATKDLLQDCTTTQCDDPVDYAAECVRLREQLEHVLQDHQRQSEEIVALRALAKTLKSEVESIHASQQRQPNEPAELFGQRGSHEFFKLDLEIEGLRIENKELTKQLQTVYRESQGLRAMLAHQLPRYKLHAVQARAQLESVVSQLREEQAHSDKLRAQLIRFKARSTQKIHVAPPRLNTGSSRISDAWDNAINSQADMDNAEPDIRGGDKENVDGNGSCEGICAQVKCALKTPGSPDCKSWISLESVWFADLVGPLNQLEDQLTQLHSTLDLAVFES